MKAAIKKYCEVFLPYGEVILGCAVYFGFITICLGLNGMA